MLTVSTLLVLMIVLARKDLLEMEICVQISMNAAMEAINVM